jgi:hypothetical protein
MRANRIWPVLAVASLFACQQSSPAPPIQPKAIEQPQAPDPKLEAQNVASLAGEWRVAGIDGRPLNESYGLPLRADEGRLWWEPLCAGMSRNYRIEGQAIRFNPTRPPRRSGEETQPVCAIGLPPRLDEVFRALDAATEVGRTEENGILIQGGGHSVTLFSQ